MKLNLDSHLFTITLKKTSSASLRLKFLSRHHLELTCHRLTPHFMINKFLNDHQSWILKNYQKIPLKRKLSSLKKLTLLDTDYLLKIQLSTKDSLIFFHDQRQIHLNTTSLSTSHLKSLFDKKLRPLALKLIKDEIILLSKQHHFTYANISVKNQKSRFGSCSSRGNLNFNWQIILFPKSIFTHIILHELTHLAIKDHSANFWNQLSVYDPNYLQHKNWLKSQASKYMIFS